MDKKNNPRKELFEIASELECVLVDLQRIQNLLQLHTEAYETERDGFLKLCGEPGRWVTERLDTLLSILEATQILLHQCTAELEAQTEAIYAEYKKGAEDAISTMP